MVSYPRAPDAPRRAHCTLQNGKTILVRRLDPPLLTPLALAKGRRSHDEILGRISGIEEEFGMHRQITAWIRAIHLYGNGLKMKLLVHPI